MSIPSRISGPLLASIFVHGGMDAYKNPESKVKAAEAVTRPLSARFEFLPDDPATLIRINGAVQVGAGVLLATGKFRRLAALTLIGSIVPTTYAGHRFWDEVDDVKRAQQKTHFFKNLGVLGGLIMTATERPARHKKRHASPDVGAAAQRVSDVARQVWHEVDDVVARDAPKVADKASQLVSSGTDLTARLIAKADDVVARDAPKVADKASQLVSSGTGLTSRLIAKAGEHIPAR